MKRCLVTGCAGFTGGYLLELLGEKKGLHLFGADIKRREEDHAPYAYFRVDLSNRKSVFRMMRDIKPDLIFHLAGGMFYTRYDDYHRCNVLGTINLLDAILEVSGRKRNKPVVIDVGSSAEYGFVDRKNIPISEETPLKPVNYYGISKMVQGLIALRYFSMSGLKVIHTRTFNLIGPGQPSNFVCGSIAQQITALEDKKTKERFLNVGNLESVRDFVDVRDAVRAYWLLAKKGKPGETYNVCSGRGLRIAQVVDLALRTVDYPVKVRQSNELCKKDEIPIQIGNKRKIAALTWKPTIHLERSLKDMLQWLRNQKKLSPI